MSKRGQCNGVYHFLHATNQPISNLQTFRFFPSSTLQSVFNMSPEELKEHVRRHSVLHKPDFDPDEKPYTLEEYAADFFR